MDLPEVPIIDLPTKGTFKCPSCRQKIAAWAVSTHFECPNCAAVLASNKKRALNRGIVVGLATYISLAVLAHYTKESLPILGLATLALGAIVAFYAGHIFYRKSVVISKWQR